MRKNLVLFIIFSISIILYGCQRGIDEKIKPQSHEEMKHEEHTHKEMKHEGHAEMKHEGHEMKEAKTAEIPMKPGTVMISPEKQQLIGIKTEVVQTRRLHRDIRTVGIVDYDERRIAKIHTKIPGWIEKVFVNFTGKLVARGQPLISIYSPELVSTQEEYLLALRAKKYISGAPYSEISSSADSLIEATRKRLLLWDISEDQIKRLEEKGVVQKSLTLYSPINGFVLERNGFEGMYVTPETNLYTVADLSTVWVYADIYEYEMPLIRTGQEAIINLSYYPQETFRGRVIYVYPYLDEKTRTVKVRFEFPNKDLRLKPQMYANIEIRIDLGRKLSVSETAVLDSGERKIVFVDLGNGHFEPREVKTGIKAKDYYEIISGLKEGERVVSSANFLIDSESRLKEAMGGMMHEHGGSK